MAQSLPQIEVPQRSDTSMLVQLSESCARHRSRHEKHGISSHPVDDEGDVPKFCQDVISSLRKILPKVEKHYCAATNPQAEDIGHICDFYEQVIEGGFCPHAPHLLRLGKRANDVLPRIHFLFENLLSVSVMDDTLTKTGSTSSARVFEKICQTAAQLLAMVPEHSVLQDVIQDWIQLTLELSFLSHSNIMEESSDQVEITMFDRATGQHFVDDKEEYVLILQNREHLYMIQFAVITVLHQSLLYLKERRLSTSNILDAMLVDMGNHYGNDDAFFLSLLTGRPEILEEVLVVTRQVLLSDIPPSSKGKALSVRSRIATLRLLQMIESDLRNIGDMSPLASLRLHFHTLIAQAVGNILRTKQDSTLSKLEASYIRKLAYCLSRTIQHTTDSRDQLDFLPLLLHNVQSINICPSQSKSNLARRALEVSVLRSIHFLLIQNPTCSGAREMFRDGDIVIRLIGLVQDPDFHEYTIWILSAFFLVETCESDLEHVCRQAMYESESGCTDDSVSSGSKRKLSDNEYTLAKKRMKSVGIDHGDASKAGSSECVEHSLKPVLEDLLELLVCGKQSDQSVSPSTDFIKILGGIRIVLNLAEATSAHFGPITEKWLRRALDVAFQFARKLEGSEDSPESRFSARRMVCFGLHVSLTQRLHPEFFVNFSTVGLPMESFIQISRDILLSLYDEADSAHIEKHPWVLDSIFHHRLHNQFIDESKEPCPRSTFVAEVFNTGVIRVSFDDFRATSQELNKGIFCSDQSDEFQNKRLNLLMSEFQIVLPDSGLSMQEKTCRVLLLLDFQRMKLQSRNLCLLSIQWLLRQTSLQELRHIFCQSCRGEVLNSSLAFGLIHFLLDCCFSEEDLSIRQRAAEILHHSFIDEGFGLVTCLLSTEEEWTILNARARNTEKLPHLQILDQLVIRFFRNVDALLHSRCSLPQSQLSLTIGSIASSNSDKSSKRDRRIEQLILHCRSATRVLLSFCTDSDDYFMKRVLQSSLSRVVRLWSGPGSSRNEIQWICFMELSRWSCLTTRSRIFGDENMKIFGPNLFREVLVPSSTILTTEGRTGIENIRDGTKELHCLLLATFIGYFILSRSTDRKFIAALNYSGVNDIERFLGSLLPYIFSQLIIEKDYDALRLTTSFKLFLLGQKHFESKQRMRISNDGVRMDYFLDVSIGSPKCMFLTSSLLSRVWKHDLEEQTGFLCSSTELFATLLPLVFTRAGESELNFFTQTVLRNRLKSLTDAIKDIERNILKTLLLELGENHLNNDPILRALKLVDHFRTVNIEPESSNPTATIYRSFKENEEGISAWITKHFMYLVVNVVQFRWRTKSDQEKVQALRSLLFAVCSLEPKESCQYFPQIVATLNAAVALYEERITHDTENVLVLAVRILSEFIKLAGESNGELLAQNLKVVVVSLVPILSETEGSHESSARRFSREVAVELLERLVQGDLGKRLAPFFSDIPFLPSNDALHGVRESLRSLGVDNDTIISTQGTQDGTSTDQSNFDTLRQEALRQRLATVCPLISHENAGVRQIALKHIIDLLKTNRYLFHAIVENEGDTSMKHYLTVIKPGTLGSSCGTVTELVEALMNRCLVETDEKTRILLATCIGEVGAIAVDRLEERSDKICVVKMEHGPWKSRAARHQLKLVTEQLVTALKAAHSSADQHKIMFTIQQVLALLDKTACKSKTSDNPTSSGKREMSDWLSAQLSDAGVLDIVEPFWWTEFCESDSVVSTRGPPFFIDATSYFGWMSNWCSYMARRAYESKETEWSELFYACRTALRTPVGLEIAEYLLPILILDRVCFGDAQDERVILDEIRSALSFGPDSSTRMLHTERQKVVNTLLDLIETLQRWHEQETESRLTGDTKTGSHEQKDNDHRLEPKGLSKIRSDSNWPLDESVLRIDDILMSIPLSLRARAAACVGMHSRAMRLFEMVSRAHVAKAVFEDTKYGTAKQTRSRAAGTCTGSELEYLMETLCSLDDYETLTCLLDDETAKTAASFSWGAIKKKEISGDWEGALQDYERAIQLQRTENNESVHLQKGALRCLLELGHFESVMNQVSGLMSESSTFGSNCSVFDEYLPASVEASWRLGDWNSLEELCNSETRKKCSRESAELIQGDIVLELKKGNFDNVMAHIKGARRLVMDKLSINASEGYSRAFRDVISLHALREIEDVAGLVCDDITSRSLGEIIAKADLAWDRRLSFVGPVGASHILDVRLALSRLAGDAVSEGSIFLKMGKLARKDGLLGTAANALSQAQAVFRRVKDDNWKGRGITRSSMHLQFAKLKHDCGECTSALRMLNIGDIDTLVHLDDSDLRLQVHERVDNFLGSDCHGMTDEETVSVFAKSVLQSTRWMIEGGLKGGSEIMSRFRILHQVAPRLEKGHFYFAKYVDSILRSRISTILKKSPEERSRESEDVLDRFAVAHDKACQRYILLAIKHYVEALVIDIRHVYQALPRLLSLWFEFTSIGNSEQFKNSILESPNTQAMQVLTQNQEEANAVIATKYKQITVPAFYTALPQLISRVKHPNNDTTMVVHGILCRVLTKYPAQAMWPLAWLRQSRQHDRQKAGNEIFREAESRLAGISNNKLHLLLVESKSLFEWLQKLAKFEPKKVRCTEIKVTPWKGQIDLEEFIPPVQAALSASFSIGDSDRSRDLFPRHVPRMRTFSPIIKVMQSKARPKILKAQVVSAEAVSKITDRTTGKKENNGCFDIGEIHFLVKQEAKGDLRKDARVQELNNVVNRLLATSTAGRTVNQRRPLRLRTFAVTCLSEDTGILEWVPDTSSFRSLIGKAYNPQVNTFSPRRRGARLANLGDPMLRRDYEKCQEIFFVSKNLKGAAKMFEELCLKTNPPLLFWWFVQAFENPNAWYEARTRFTRSSAAWAAVGHVLGVGDRHAENILVDTSSGECVHVDFDCIFDKGLHLPKPEVVPFRLTQNMLDAFGPTGADGIFSDTLYKAMHTLRDNRDTLLSVLEPFLKDPIIDWKRSRSQQQNKISSGEDHNAKEAKRSISVIDERLRGIYNLRNPNYKRIRRNDTFVDQEDEELTHMLPLSVEGQVHKMIAEATSNENLVQMYIGWMAWL